jgi:hypothetical protein
MIPRKDDFTAVILFGKVLKYRFQYAYRKLVMYYADAYVNLYAGSYIL